VGHEDLCVIRGDDVNFFTSPQELERVYKPPLELNMPINLAVIPLVDSQVNEPFVKTKYTDGKRYYPVYENTELIEFIKQYNLEVLQHGLTHSVYQRCPRIIHEFRINNEKKLYTRAILGQRIIEKAFGKKPQFFIPPRDTLSRQAYRVLMKLFKASPLQESLTVNLNVCH